MNINFTKYADGLVPAIIQDAQTKTVLMLGFMNQAAIDLTVSEKKVTFFSRTKNRLWTKGEESGHYLHYISMEVDCDQDTLLIQANPSGPVCHNGTATCWGDDHASSFLPQLESIIAERKNADPASSYVASLFEKGINKIAQKVGEEAVELVIEAKDSNHDLFLNESADLLFHYLILLQVKGYQLSDVSEILKQRHKN
ncbi:MAG: bifunctional phosphoribosyl-AMP cyclohydrolase/phosphoribosyl-ATP diphosphatase HisIE [Bacteroidetes bacterium]|nr:bifunctional phosphoribosyl-AMP cyclohydrolase/phosphoribosyl-ATP diphosphatase HisIE [Bacteroidota bacterium]